LFRYDPTTVMDISSQPSRRLKSSVPVVISQQNEFMPHLDGVTVLQFPSGFTDAAKSEMLREARLEVMAYAPDRSLAYVRSREGRSAVSTSMQLQSSFSAKVNNTTGTAMEYAGAVSWGFIDGGLQGAKGLAVGAFNGGKSLVMEPLYVVADDLATGYILAFQPEWGDYYQPMSGIRKAVEAGYEPGEIVHQAVVGVAQTPGRFVQALTDGDSEKIGEEYVNLVALVLPFKGANLSFPAKSIGMIPVAQRMTASGALAMQYAQVTIRTVTIDGVEVAQGTLIAMCEATGNVGGAGGVGGGDPTQPAQTNPNAAGSANLTPETEAKILDGEWRLGDDVNGDFVGGHKGSFIDDPRVQIQYEWLPSVVPGGNQGVRALKFQITRPNGIPFTKGKPSSPHSLFPATWSDDKIIAAVKEVASTGSQVKPMAIDGTVWFEKVIDGITIRAVVQNGDITAGFPWVGKLPNPAVP
jgi:hypothetical protein